jgi:hypothetical protein
LAHRFVFNKKYMLEPDFFEALRIGVREALLSE